ncbi:MAG: Nucleoside transporter, periplasmic nucleoside-binding protein [Hyphomicrobiales bacterium]|nr:Nucleoside transporter, periplasmic nucleoside-binding protein [Hyphomicrobiales bacterium]
MKPLQFRAPRRSVGRLVGLLATVFLTFAGLVTAAHADPLKIAMILPGPITDNDWNSVGYNGLQAASKALGVEVSYAENVSDADAERVLRDFAQRGYGLIFAHSFSFGDAALNAADDFPNTVFMAGTASKLTSNLGTYSNPDYQGAYLTGMLAAGASKSGAIGWVGGMPAPNMLANLHAYEAGAKEINSKVKVMHTFIGSWYDPPKTKEAAIAQVEQGADVLSAQGVGVIDAAVAKRVYALGAMTDQNHLGPNVVLTSVTWDLGPLITDVAKAVMLKTWKSANLSYGISKGSVQLADFHGLDKNIDPAAMKKMLDRMAAIKAGDFVVPLDTTNPD